MTPNRMAEIHAAAFAETGDPWPEAELAAMLARPLIHPVVLDDDGFALLQILPPEAEILTLAVDPRAQGRGRGAALLARAIALARNAGAEVMFLEVAADNSRARALYARAGFGQSGLRRGYYARADAPFVDALTLTLSLGAAKIGTACES